MFLCCKTRHKDGKSHRYWSVVESRRVRGGRIIQRHVLYLGEINDGQEAAWRRSIAVFADGAAEPRQMALFPEGRALPVADSEVVQIRLDALALRRPRQWGGCWLAGALWDQLQLDGFWSARLKPSRKGTRWLNVLKTLVFYRLLDPGSEWRLHRQWFEASAMADVLGEDVGLVQIDKLYRCLDKLLVHKEDFFSFLKGRWQSLFGIGFDVLLYDLTSIYFEIDPPAEGKRRFGYSRDKRLDCVQVVIALIVTPEGLPLAYEVMPGNTADNTTLAEFLARIEVQYGKANRTWVMDRGIPTEDVLAEMRQSNPPVHYLVGTPKGRLSRLETALLDKPWHDARPGVQVKLLAQDGEIYIFAESRDRVANQAPPAPEKAVATAGCVAPTEAQPRSVAAQARRRQEGGRPCLRPGRHPLARQRRTAQPRYLRLHPAQGQAASDARAAICCVPTSATPTRRSSGVITSSSPRSSRPSRSSRAIWPIYHQLDHRIEAHIFVAFVAYCLFVTLKQRLRPLAPGLTPRAVLEKLCAMRRVDVNLPTTDGRHLILPRYTQPDRDQLLLLQRLKLTLPPQPPPRITTTAENPNLPAAAL